jgi:hypothetical protein
MPIYGLILRDLGSHFTMATAFRRLSGSLDSAFSDSGLSADCNRLQFKMPATQEGSCADEFTRWQVLRREVASVGGVEFVVERKVSAGDLYVDKVIHAHPGLNQRSFHAVEQKLEFHVNVRGGIAGFGIDSDPTGEVECIPGEDRATERQLGVIVGEINGTSRGLRRL